jgi:hypothetical protein
MTLAEAISAFGAAAKAKLANSASTGQPEDQLRNPLETLFSDLSQILGQAPGTTVLVGETSLADLRRGPICPSP